MSRLRKRLAQAGLSTVSAPAVIYHGGSSSLLPVRLSAPPRFCWPHGAADVVAAVIAALVGYMVPGFVLQRLIKRARRSIENGLPDALDLLIVCVEAGCGSIRRS